MEIVLKLDNFEGPLDLLLSLIENKKMKISDISIHRLIDDYLEILRLNSLAHDMEIKADFLVLATELIEIKTLALLNLDREKEKEKALIKKLEDYKNFKEVSIELAKMENEYNIAYSRGLAIREIKKVSKEYDLRDIEVSDIFEVFKNFVNSDKFKTRIQIVIEKKYDLFEEMENVVLMIYEKGIDFEEIFLHAKDRMHAIYIFLAILELYKEGRIKIENQKLSLRN